MRKTPRTTLEESPQAQYDRLLGESIETQTDFERLIGNAGEDDRLQDEMDDGKSVIDGLLRRRVALLKQIAHLRTIEDAFPRVKSLPQADRKDVDAAALILAFSRGRVSVDDLRAAGKSLESKNDETLTDQELQAFLKARVALARESGYTVESIPKHRAFTLRRNGVAFTMDHYAFPSESGIAGHSRISVLVAWTGTGRKEQRHLSYNDGYNHVCTEADVQHEIDRVVAIFG